jgi:hypothetical protein
MQPRRFGPDGLAEQHDDTEFVWINTEGESKEGDDSRCRRGDEEQKGAGETSAARHDLLELVLAAL